VDCPFSSCVPQSTSFCRPITEVYLAVMKVNVFHRSPVLCSGRYLDQAFVGWFGVLAPPTTKSKLVRLYMALLHMHVGRMSPQ